MKALQWHEIAGLAVKQVGKPAVYVSNGLDLDKYEDEQIWLFVQEQVKMFYGAKTDDFYRAMAFLVTDGLFFFDSEEQQREFYHIFEQPLTDSSGIYACTYSADGICKTENT